MADDQAEAPAAEAPAAEEVAAEASAAEEEASGPAAEEEAPAAEEEATSPDTASTSVPLFYTGETSLDRESDRVYALNLTGETWDGTYRCHTDCGGCLLTTCCCPLAICYMGDIMGGKVGEERATGLGLLKCCCATQFLPISLCCCPDWIACCYYSYLLEASQFYLGKKGLYQSTQTKR